jgi:2-methylcitrate dehydratase PrpD
VLVWNGTIRDVGETASQRLASWATLAGAGSFPETAIERASLHVLDALGCAIAASALDLGGEGRAVAAAQRGAEEAEVIGHWVRMPAPLAALANGTLAHALDYDDTHPPSICHVSSVVAPAAIAVAQSVGATGRAALEAYLVGVEAVARIGAAAPGAFHARGFHPTGVCGVFGAALAAARLLGLDAERTTAALGIAGSFGVGLLEFLGDGTTTKRLHAGGASQAGVQAALLARWGGEGPTGVLDGPRGLFASHLGVVPELELATLGERWAIEEVAIKPYPCCHFIHGVLDAAAGLLDGLDVDRIERVEVVVSEPAAAMVLEPRVDKLAPRTPYDAKFSLPFALAALLVSGRVGVDTFEVAALADPAILALAGRVTHLVGPLASPFGGAVAITLADGTTRSARVEEPTAVTREAALAKFRANAGLLLDGAGVVAHEARVLGLPWAPDARLSPT